MDRALVVLSGDESDHSFLAEARQYAASADTEIMALMTVTREEWENDQGVLKTIAAEEQTSYENKSPAEYAGALADRIATEALAEESVAYETVGEVVEADARSDAILEVAREYDCDHVFLHGRRRSPTGKAIFGDATQVVILNFDGYVTVSTRD